jgi:hypothetical protein
MAKPRRATIGNKYDTPYLLPITTRLALPSPCGRAGIYTATILARILIPLSTLDA